jgi:hypothetical protein
VEKTLTTELQIDCFFDFAGSWKRDQTRAAQKGRTAKIPGILREKVLIEGLIVFSNNQRGIRHTWPALSGSGKNNRIYMLIGDVVIIKRWNSTFSSGKRSGVLSFKVDLQLCLFLCILVPGRNISPPPIFVVCSGH